jgi:hypothetical protein
MENWRREAIFSVILILFSLTFFIYSYQSIDPPFAQGLASSGTYVRIWLSILTLLGLILLIKSMIKKNKTKMEAMFSITVVYSIIVLLLYILIMPIIGYFISTILFLFAISSYYNFYNFKVIKDSKKLIITKLIKLFFFSLIVTMITQYIFANILRVLLPRSQLF